MRDDWNTLKLSQPAEYVVALTMNRPQRRNAVSFEMARELEACLAGLLERQDIRVLILTGEGSAFGAGADLKERVALTPEIVQQQRHAGLRIVRLLEAFPAPVIAMINGPAFAGSLELALACDIRVASDRAVFALSELRNTGSFPGAGGPVRLAKMIGRGRASYIVLSGRQFQAQEALQLGLVELVVPHPALLEQTMALAREIAGNSPLGVAAAKQLIRRSVDLDTDAATALSQALRDPQDGSADYAEGIKAWLGGRAPEFKSP
jgi:enoyl-CoA hydratase/carnithine racemase